MRQLTFAWHLKLGNHFFRFKYARLQSGIIGIKSNAGYRKRFHVLFIDVDGELPESVIGLIQEFYDTTHFYKINSSKGHYHWICPSLFSMGEVVDVMELIDMFTRKQKKRPMTQKYRIFGMLREGWVLRISEKGKKGRPVIVKAIPRMGGCKRTSSRAHWLALQKLYLTKIRLPVPHNLDGSRLIPINRYPAVKEMKDE